MTADQKKKVALVTVGRSDFSIVLPLCKMLNEAEEIQFGLWVGGAHFDEVAGNTVEKVRETGLPIWAEINVPSADGTGLSTSNNMAGQLSGFGEAANKHKPDLVIILGDRFEAISAGLAMIPFNIPIAHISGGSVTHGAIDDVFRHCLTKLSKLHFCEIPEYADRIAQLGEARSTIYTVGALGIDGIRSRNLDVSFGDFADEFNFGPALREGFILANLHSETNNLPVTRSMAKNMIAALEQTEMPVIYTYPNSDPGYEDIIEEITAAAKRNPHHFIVKNFGAKWYYVAMNFASMMVGNSSSGIIEAASLDLSVVNIGDRQAGRYCGRNVLHSTIEKDSILKMVTRAASDEFQKELVGFLNPYGDGRAAEKIMKAIIDLELVKISTAKQFVDILEN